MAKLLVYYIPRLILLIFVTEQMIPKNSYKVFWEVGMVVFSAFYRIVTATSTYQQS